MNNNSETYLKAAERSLLKHDGLLELSHAQIREWDYMRGPVFALTPEEFCMSLCLMSAIAAYEETA